MTSPEQAPRIGRMGVGPEPASSSGRWREIQRVVDAALDLPPAERAAFVCEACGPDVSLSEQARRLLEACERAADSGGLFAGPAGAFAAPMLAELAVRDAAAAAERRSALADALRVALAERYVVERELGRGGMAAVYLARDLRHERAVAVKVLERDVVAPGGAQRFLQEIRTAAGLTHPHVLGVHDSGDANGLLYYVMPYVEGETLRARLAREGALPFADAVRLLRELADALAYAHARGIVHRDLKPENVLLSGGHAVVADFGIAKALAAATQDGAGPSSALTSAGMALGTPAYMAPEQAVGDAATDHRADLYALGVVAYEVLAGAHPFSARTPQALVTAHLTELPAPVSTRRTDVPPALAALVMRLLSKDPAARPQSADDVLGTLDGVTPAPVGTASWRRGLWIAAAAILLAAAGVGGYAVWERAPGLLRGGADAARAPAPIRTVAVLPFVNTGGAAADDYFSDGMTDELAHALARLPGLRLAGRTSSYAFKGKAVAAQEIGRVLDVGALVGGTVRRAGDRLRVTAQLVSTADGKVLWDSVYESRMGDVFAVQDEVTRAVVAALTPALGDRRGAVGMPSSPGGRGTTDAEAYELYLKGRYYFLERGAANIGRAIAYYRQAVARDPAFARAHAGLAMAYTVLRAYVPDPKDSTTALVVASAERAVALDSMLADGQVALADGLKRQLRFHDAEKRFRAALALDPSNVLGHHWLGLLLLSLGRTDEAIAELRQATQLDPLAKSAGTAFGYALFTARRFPEAERAERRVLALDSSNSLALWGLGITQAFGGQPDSAVRTLERGVRLYPERQANRRALLFAYAAAGRWAEAERLRAQLRRPSGDPFGGSDAAFADLVFGDREPLVRLLTTAAGQRDWSLNNLGFGCNPFLDPLWFDARFRAAMRRLTVEVCPLARPWPLPPRVGG